MWENKLMGLKAYLYNAVIQKCGEILQRGRATTDRENSQWTSISPSLSPILKDTGRLSTYHHVEMALLSYKFKGEEASTWSEKARTQSQALCLSVQGCVSGCGVGGRGYPCWVPLLLPSLPQASISNQGPHSGQVSQRMFAPLFPGLGTRLRLFNEVPWSLVPRKQDLKDRKAHWERQTE